jgi:hypothetical protein
MASVPRAGLARFVASEQLARLALHAAEPHENLPAVGGGVWVSFLGEAVFFDEAARFAQGKERLQATPEGLAAPDAKDIVLRTQQAIGTRVERLLSSLGFEAAARKEKTAPVSSGEHFTPHVREALLNSLPIPRAHSEPILTCLMKDLRMAAKDQTIAGDWGALREGTQGLFLEIAAPLERLPADRPRARVVGGLAKERRV